MYSINGFNLDDNDLGGVLMFASEPYAGLQRRTNSFPVGLLQGQVAAPFARDSVAIRLVERLPAEGLEAFLALLDAESLSLTRNGRPSIAANVELLSASVENLETADATVEVSFALKYVEGCSRDLSVSTTTPVAISSGSVTATAFSGISAPVADATIRVKGPVSGLRVEDSSGSWWTYDIEIPSGTSLLFTNGVAHLSTASDSDWTIFTENVSARIDFGGPRGVFELTPYFTTPTSRTARITVTTSSRGAGAQVVIRGRGAYLV